MIKHIQLTETILYVNNQELSTQFYQQLLRTEPTLYVPGMTEFTLSENAKLGLMPNSGIAKILGQQTPHPENGTGIPRCELYFYVNNLAAEFENAVRCGARLISGIALRSWGDEACYFSDPDGHIIAFAFRK